MTGPALRRMLRAAAVASTLMPAMAFAAEEQVIGGYVESLLEFARVHHPEFAATRLEAAASAARVVPAGALPDPVLRTELRDITNANTDAGANLLPARVGSTRYTILQSLPWFGKRELRQEVAAAGADEAQGKAQITWAELARRIKLTYVQHHVHLTTLRFANEDLDLLQRLEQIAQTRYARGLAPQQDVIRAQAEQTALKSDLAMLDGESEQASARMRSLLGRPANVRLLSPEKLRLMPAPAKLEPAALEARLRAKSPQLLANDARVAGAEKNRELVYKNRYPDFNIGISPIQNRNRVGEWELMFEVNIPLQQESRRHQERETDQLLEATRLRREADLNQALSELSEGLSGLRAVRRVEELVSTSLLPQAELTLQAALAGYENGKLDFATLLDAQRQIRKAKLDRLKAQAEAQARLADIERLLGEEI
jgi:cobalt-zinc-cadmium efflux system outer membrane protein